MNVDDINGPSIEEDPREEQNVQFDKVADQLAQLSGAEDYPSGFDATRDSFEPADVSFDSDAWLLRVLDVQAWLNLDETIDPTAAASDASLTATHFFRLLGATEPGACLEAVNGATRPSLAGLDLLGTRLDSALHLKQKFQELRETQSRRQATDAWIELWDEELAAPETLEPIKATAATWPIQEFVDKAVRNRLDLNPTYQRGDVWSTDLYQQLIVSILRGIPLPSIILLKPQSQRAGGRYEVVDGKQRLTAILRFIAKHPEARRKIREADDLRPSLDFVHLFETNYKRFRRVWKREMGDALTAAFESDNYFPFRLPSESKALSGPLEALRGKYYHEICDLPIQIGAGQETVRDVFEHYTNYRIPVIEYTDAAPRQIHEVFKLYNRQGKHLNAEEMRNAVFHELALMKLLLLASGDNTEVKILAPYLTEEGRTHAREVGELLTDYSFGTSRYKRTKLLGWLTALVLQPAQQEDGSLGVRSTAKHIDAMLENITRDVENRRDPLYQREGQLRSLIDDLHNALNVHSSAFQRSCAPEFKDDADGDKWQELQLVASLVGVFLVCAVRPDAADLFEQLHARIRSFTSQHRRPEKTQNRTQWGFIGKVALGIVDLAGVDMPTLERRLIERYGTNCVPTLRAALPHYAPRQLGAR